MINSGESLLGVDSGRPLICPRPGRIPRSIVAGPEIPDEIGKERKEKKRKEMECKVERDGGREGEKRKTPAR